MSTAIIVAVLIVIAVIAIRSYAKKLTSGCCGGETEHYLAIIKLPCTMVGCKPTEKNWNSI